MKDKFEVSMFGQKRLSREGGIEIVVKELCTRMAKDGCAESLVLQEIDKQHRSCWMACLNWNIEDMIRPDWLSGMEKIWHRS